MSWLVNASRPSCVACLLIEVPSRAVVPFSGAHRAHTVTPRRNAHWVDTHLQREMKQLFREQTQDKSELDMAQFTAIYIEATGQTPDVAEEYASNVFNTFDVDNSGGIGFDEFIAFLSVSTRGTKVVLILIVCVCARGRAGVRACVLPLLPLIRAPDHYKSSMLGFCSVKSLLLCSTSTTQTVVGHLIWLR